MKNNLRKIDQTGNRSKLCVVRSEQCAKMERGFEGHQRDDRIIPGIVIKKNLNNIRNMFIDKLWGTFRVKQVLTFGKECSIASSMMFVSLLMRLLLRVLRIDWFVPNGFVFANPFVIQVILLLFLLMWTITNFCRN